MSEVNGPNFSINQINLAGLKKTLPDTSDKATSGNDEAPKINDFSNPKAEALGRSMLLKKVDDTNHDLKVLIDNPQIAENSDKAFETTFKALKDAGIDEPYEKAVSVATTSV